jgi:hypothetical protein
MDDYMTDYRQPKRIPLVSLLLLAIITALLMTTQLSADNVREPLTDPAQTPRPVAAAVAQSPNQSIDTVLQAGFVIDHHSIDLFEQIPESYVTAARETDMLFSDRSVGQNINEALNCLTASSWGSAPASCRRDYYDANWNWKTYTEADRNNGIVPARILFDPDPNKYNRSNWTFVEKSGSWSELTQDFIQVLAPANVNSKDVLSYQLSYLNVDIASDIADPDTGFFADNPDRYNIYDLEAYIAQHPDKVFIFWTTSLARSIGTQPATDFNNQMRQYAQANNKILFDMADIISHTDQGTPCYDNQNDGQDFPAICPDYTTEANGGHLGSVSGGKIRMAKAFWVLMARVAGWEGGETSPNTPTPTLTATVTGTSPTDTPTPTMTTTATSTPTVTGTPPTQTPTPTMTVTGTPPTVTPTATQTNGTIPPLSEKVYAPAISN